MCSPRYGCSRCQSRDLRGTPRGGTALRPRKRSLRLRKTKRLGAPVLIDVRVQADILRLHAEGASLRQIAAALNASGAKPARGGMRWYASTIKSVIDRCEAGNVAA